jgi:hypothetical protein
VTKLYTRFATSFQAGVFNFVSIIFFTQPLNYCKLRFEFITVVDIKIMRFWDITLHS